MFSFFCNSYIFKEKLSNVISSQIKNASFFRISLHLKINYIITLYFTIFSKLSFEELKKYTKSTKIFCEQIHFCKILMCTVLLGTILTSHVTFTPSPPTLSPRFIINHFKANTPSPSWSIYDILPFAPQKLLPPLLYLFNLPYFFHFLCGTCWCNILKSCIPDYLLYLYAKTYIVVKVKFYTILLI